MNRRNFVKGMTAFGVASLIPCQCLFAKRKNHNSIHFIGLGGGGCNTLALFKKKGINGQYTFIAPGEKIRTYLPEIINLIDFKSPTEYIDWNREFVLDNNPLPIEIQSVFKEKKHYVLVSGLGRYIGTSLTYKLFNYLTKENISFDFYCCTPFEFEGKKPVDFAREILVELRDKPNFYYLNNESLRYKYPGLRLKEAFNKADEELYFLYNRKNI